MDQLPYNLYGRSIRRVTDVPIVPRVRFLMYITMVLVLVGIPYCPTIYVVIANWRVDAGNSTSDRSSALLAEAELWRGGGGGEGGGGGGGGGGGIEKRVSETGLNVVRQSSWTLVNYR